MRLTTLLISSFFIVPANAFAGLHAPVHEFHDTALVLQHSGVAFLKNMAGMYSDALTQHPLITKMATGGALATAGDAIAQFQSDEPYDKRRASSFMAFDMSYRALQHAAFPAIVHQFHGQYLSALLASTALAHMSTDYLAAMEQTLASQLGIVPFLYYPVFFALTGVVQKLTTEAAIERAKENFLPLMKRNLLFWIPVQFIQFGFIDEQLQIPFLSVAGLCWTFVLSLSAGSTKNYSKEDSSVNVPDVAPPLDEQQDETFAVPGKDTRVTVSP